MNERIMQFRVGVMILATILIAAILVLLFMGSSPLLHGTYTIYIKFNDAPGVTRDTPVRKAGIRIGRVRNVQFADDDTGVIVTAEIDRDRHLYDNEQCKATSSLLMGDASLEFVRIANFQGEKAEIKDGAVLQGQLAPDMTSSIAGLQRQAAQTLARSTRPAATCTTVLTRVDGLLAKNEERINHMIGEADEMMQLAKQALGASNDLLGDPELRKQIKQTISEMPAVLKETRSTVERIGRHLRLAAAEHAEYRGPDQAAGRSRGNSRRRVRRQHEKAQPAERQHAAVQRGVEQPAGLAGSLIARQGALSARQSHGEEPR